MTLCPKYSFSPLSNKEMYSFLDKSGRKLCLRPEFTSSVVRAVLNSHAADSVNRVYYVCFLFIFHKYGSAYRYENPQHGRYREFHQFGGEIIHCDPDNDDTEIISLCHSILSRLYLLSQSELLINSLGSEEEMKAYRKALLVDPILLSSYFQSYFSNYYDSLSNESQHRFDRGSVLRILDSKQEADHPIIASSPSITSFLSSSSLRVLFSFTCLLSIAFRSTPERSLRSVDPISCRFAFGSRTRLLRSHRFRIYYSCRGCYCSLLFGC